jgi:hypothetical protein
MIMVSLVFRNDPVVSAGKQYAPETEVVRARSDVVVGHTSLTAARSQQGRPALENPARFPTADSGIHP